MTPSRESTFPGTRARYQIYPNVNIGSNVSIGNYVELGVPPRGHMPGGLESWIGDEVIIRSHSVIYAGNKIGHRLETGHAVMIRELNEIGHDVSIGTHSVIEHHVKIGNNVRIHSQAFIPEFSVLEDGCWIGPSVVLTNSRYPLSAGEKDRLKGPTICRGAKIGANATILPSVVIGEDSVIGAGAVVVRDVPAGKIVVGNPARIVKDVSDVDVYFRG